MSALSKSRKIIIWGGLVIVVALLATKFLFIGYYQIPQDGMYPGLPAGSRLFTAKRAYASAAKVKRGDIVVFIRDEDGPAYIYIWRVVGLPGDKIDAAGESLAINGKAVERERLREADGRAIFREKLDGLSYEVAFDKSPEQAPPDVSTNVPADHFFVMGDNRYGANDSRYFGPIPFRAIVGKKL